MNTQIEKLQKNMADLQAEIDALQLKELIHSDDWPAAIDPLLICDTTLEEDKQDRAEGILDLIVDTHLDNLKFLDFGCGEGHVVMKSLEQQPAFSIGYDIHKPDRWESWPKNEKVLLTTDWKKVEENKPYNAILMYDVLDHMLESEEEIVSRLSEIKSFLAPKAKIYVRCHPWCSRHGTHLYHKINKAYVHLVFDDAELEEMNYIGYPTRKLIDPLKSYQDWFRRSGLRAVFGPHILKKAKEIFFADRKIANRLKGRWKESNLTSQQNPGQDSAIWKFIKIQTEQEFIDYILQ